MAVMRYLQAVRLAMTEEMRRDPKVFILGEEVAQYQGTYRVTEGMLQEFGPERVVDTPISEIGIAGMATGAAMTGLRPVAEFMTWSFALSAMDQLVNHAAKITYMSGGRIQCPVVFRGPAGVGTQLSAQHSHSLESWFAHTPGFKVAMPATPADAKGLLKTAIRDNNPVIFMEHAGLYGLSGEVPEDPDFMVPFGQAVVRREGTDITLIGYSRGLQMCLKAAETLAKDNISAEVIDLRTLVPLDMDTVVASLKKTHRAVVVQEEWRNVGFAAEVATRIYEQAFDEMDSPVERVAGADVPMPYAKNLERAAIPTDADVVAAAKRALG